MATGVAPRTARIFQSIFSEGRFTPLEEALRILTRGADRGMLEKAIAKIGEGSPTE